MINPAYKHKIPEEIREWLTKLVETLPKGYTVVAPSSGDLWQGEYIEKMDYGDPEFKPSRLTLYAEKAGPADSTTDSGITLGIAWEEMSKRSGKYPEL